MGFLAKDEGSGGGTPPQMRDPASASPVAPQAAAVHFREQAPAPEEALPFPSPSRVRVRHLLRNHRMKPSGLLDIARLSRDPARGCRPAGRQICVRGQNVHVELIRVRQSHHAIFQRNNLPVGLVAAQEFVQGTKPRERMPPPVRSIDLKDKVEIVECSRHAGTQNRAHSAPGIRAGVRRRSAILQPPCR